MDSTRMEHRNTINSLAIKNHKKSNETIETINDTLPAIQQSQSNQKANVIRNQLNDTKSQIILMQAKLRKLKDIKQMHQRKNQKNMTKIEFINNVKQRNLDAFEYKQKVKRERQESLQQLKHQAWSIRETLIGERLNAENSLYTLKVNEAHEERRRHRQHQYLIKKLKELDTIQNSKKADRIKELHQTSSQKLKQFHDSRIHFSKDNYQKKVLKTLKQKQRAKSTLDKLKQQQQKILNDVKASQQAMLTSLYSLQNINPEKRKRFKSTDKSNKYEIDYYSHQSFDT